MKSAETNNGAAGLRAALTRNECRRQGNASLEVPNLRGVTPLAMLQAAGGGGGSGAADTAVWVGARVWDKVREREAAKGRRSFLRRLSYDKVPRRPRPAPRPRAIAHEPCCRSCAGGSPWACPSWPST